MTLSWGINQERWPLSMWKGLEVTQSRHKKWVSLAGSQQHGTLPVQHNRSPVAESGGGPCLWRAECVQSGVWGCPSLVAAAGSGAVWRTEGAEAGEMSWLRG